METKPTTGDMPKTDAQWRSVLTDEQYHVLREKGTERPFTGELLQVKDDGTFACAACDTPLFSSTSKFNSGTGWPSFWDVADSGNVALHPDTAHGMVRTEVTCATCGGHLGHLFDDGPGPTGQRYCINSAALKFQPETD